MSSHGIVVVGGGIAGQSVCEAIRLRDRTTPVTLVCGEPRLPYDRVRLSELLVDGRPTEALELRPPEWFEDHDVRTLVGVRATRLDTEARRIALDGGEHLDYDALVLCTGSTPLMPPIPGIDLPGVVPFRGPGDCDAIRAAAAGGA
ncbi:MAG: FAD-dependent oxidoreductase, partial [Solirubrobacteraceae bacterium]